MKDMEIKTENRYEYRKTQEKRKQMIAPDLFEFAYVPDWYGHLAECPACSSVFRKALSSGQGVFFHVILGWMQQD